MSGTVVTDDLNLLLDTMRPAADIGGHVVWPAALVKLAVAELTRLADLALQQHEDLEREKRRADNWETYVEHHDCWQEVGERW